MISPAEHGGGRPALHLAKPGAELELILSDDKKTVVAVIIPEPIDIHQIEHLYALGHGIWRDCIRLARHWRVWGILADPNWADRQTLSPAARPQGAKFFFVS